MSVLIYNSSQDLGERSNPALVDFLFKGESLSELDGNAPDKTCHRLWNIKNKYYSAHVRLFCSSGLESRSSLRFSNHPVKAIVYFAQFLCPDGEKSVVSDLENWHRVAHGDEEEEDDEDTVKLVVCDALVPPLSSSTDSAERLRTEVLTWATSRGVEIVDLSDQEEDEDDQLPFGSQKSRVVAALQACTSWPAPPVGEGSGDEHKQEEPSFEELFAKLAGFKATADQLSQGDRRQMAGEIALAFYSAMGGEDGETQSEDEDKTV